MTRNIFVSIAAAVAASSMLPSTGHAAVKAADSAVSPAYGAEQDGAWKGTYPDEENQWEQNLPGNDNGGTGFLPWDFGGGYHLASDGPYGVLNHFIDGVDFPTTSFNNLGATAFGLSTALTGSQSITTTATRPFAEPLAVNDVFSVDIDTPADYDDFGTQHYPFVFISFKNAAGVGTLGLAAGDNSSFGPYNWRYTDKNLTDQDVNNIGPTDTSDGSALSLEVTTATSGRVTLDGFGFDVEFADGLPASIVFTLYQNNAEADDLGQPTGEHAFYFDNLKIESPGGSIPGDFDDSGTVDGADLAQWKGDFGVNDDSNADGDMDSDGNDFLIWQQNFGMGAALISAAAIPEPGLGSFLLAASPFLLRIKRRRTIISN